MLGGIIYPMAEVSSDQLSLPLFEGNIKPSYWVNQSTTLINAIQDLTITERRIIYTLIALVQPDDKDFKKYVIGVKDLAQLLEYKGNAIYKQVQNAIDGLMGKQLVIHSNDGKQDIVDKIQWVQHARYEMGTGRITIQLSDGLARYLLNLEKYAKYRLYNVLRLSSEYSWRIYELLKEYEWKKERIIRVDELRKLLSIPDDKMKLMKVFRKTVLEKAKTELKEKTDIEFKYEVYSKAGRNIESFIFYIDKNKKFKRPQIELDSLREDMESIIHTLIRQGIRRDVAEKVAHEYDYQYVDANLRYVLSLDSLEVKNKAGYILSALEDNYAGFDGPAKRETEDPMKSLFIGQTIERLKAKTEKDNKSLEGLYKLFEKRLLENRDVNLKAFQLQRKEAFFERFDIISEDRRKQKHPPLLKADINHSTIAELFEEWEQIDKEVY